jgi:hypothetical protein
VRLLAVTVLPLVAACSSGSAPVTDARDDDFLTGGKADGTDAITAAEGDAVLELVNAASLAELDDEVPLDRRAAEGIVAHREDDPFDDLAELDAIAWVGPIAFAALVEYVHEQGLVDQDEDDAACLIISEYAEGSGNYNKAIEVFNCGDAPVALDEYSLCLVRDDATSCTQTKAFAAVELAAGDVFVACRRDSTQFIDPSPALVAACGQEMSGVLTMSGDDRLAIVDDDGTVLDAFGRLSWRPPFEMWANMVLRRCDLRPQDGTAFFVLDDWFEPPTPSGNDFSQFGTAPTPGC